MGNPEDSEKVRPALRRVEAELARHLEEACEDYDRDNIAEESTDELVRLEEELLAAARAVDEAVKLRRKLGEPPKEQNKLIQSSPAAPSSEGTRVREFRTASGSEWRVWEVRPGAGGQTVKPELYPADYAQGWLAFELLEGERRKRLPRFAPEWSAASDQDLEALLEKAVDVPKRKGAESGGSDRGGLGGGEAIGA